MFADPMAIAVCNEVIAFFSVGIVETAIAVEEFGHWLYG
jgi:hypothetical protein